MHIYAWLTATPTPAPEEGGGTTENPIANLRPRFDFLGAEFNAWWAKAFAAAWALAVIVCIAFLLRNLVGMMESRGGHPGQLKESRTAAVQSALVLGCVLGFGVIIGALIKIFG